jgi:mono/diheme cytochrome c family protein
MPSHSRRAVICSISLFACSILIFFFLNRSFAHASSADARERGATAFHTKGCESCHSITGVGGDRAPDLGSVGQRRKTDQIRAQILKGSKSMPPFEGVLSKDEVKDLVAFLTSCRTDVAPGCREWTASSNPQ